MVICSSLISGFINTSVSGLSDKEDFFYKLEIENCTNPLSFYVLQVTNEPAKLRKSILLQISKKPVLQLLMRFTHWTCHTVTVTTRYSVYILENC